MAELRVDAGVGKFTFIKVRPEPLSTGKFAPYELIQLPHGYTMRVDERTIVEDKGGHLLIEFRLTVQPKSGPRAGEKITWTKGYICGSHWKGISKAFQAKAAPVTRFSEAGSSIILQPTPCFQQCNNKDWADDGSVSNLRYGAVQCGLTSAAMLIATIWPNAKVAQLAAEAGGQFEDWVAGQFKRLGRQSISMDDHVAVLAALGIKSYATRSATIGQLKQALHKHPAILGMAYKTDGHFSTAVGVADKPGDLPDKWPVGKIDTSIAYPQDADEAGVIQICPYGHRDYSGSGNNWFNISQKITDTFGLHRVLNNSVLERFWVDGGEESGWAVFLDPSTPNAGNRAEKPVEFAAPASKTITQADIDRVAKMLGCETKALKAVMAVEAGGGGFLPDGRAKILFEAHWFGDYTGYQYNSSNPGISSKGWNRDLYIGGAGEWDRFAEAAKLDRASAIKSCSWGLPQLMGGNAIEMSLGYKGEEDFYACMMRSEGDQLEAMGRFIAKDSGMLAALRSKDWAEFAYRYNGEGYAANSYDLKLADAYAQA
jgi:N-acetylmuramidase